MVNIRIKSNKLMNSGLLVPKDRLQDDFWDQNKLNPEISKILMDIAQDIVESMEIKAEIKDIIITGSMAGYNWHDLSDIDLHILLDFEEINEDFELVKRMLDQSRINWNKAHDIFIKGHEVELYFQNFNEAHKSQGIWSLMSNTWIKEPKKEKADLDLASAERKAEVIVVAIEHVEDLFLEGRLEEAHEYASKIKNKIRNLRSAGLKREGVYSPENLAFKMLRNSNYLEKLSNLKVQSYDGSMSLTETYVKDYFSSSSDPEYLEFEGDYDLENLLDPDKEAPWGPTEKEE